MQFCSRTLNTSSSQTQIDVPYVRSRHLHHTHQLTYIWGASFVRHSSRFVLVSFSPRSTEHQPYLFPHEAWKHTSSNTNSTICFFKLMNFYVSSSVDNYHYNKCTKWFLLLTYGRVSSFVAPFRQVQIAENHLNILDFEDMERSK